MADQPKVVRFRAERDPTTGGGMSYRTVGGAQMFGSMKQMKAAFPKGTEFQRVKATRRNKLFG